VPNPVGEVGIKSACRKTRKPLICTRARRAGSPGWRKFGIGPPLRIGAAEHDKSVRLLSSQNRAETRRFWDRVAKYQAWLSRLQPGPVLAPASRSNPTALRAVSFERVSFLAQSPQPTREVGFTLEMASPERRSWPQVVTVGLSRSLRYRVEPCRTATYFRRLSVAGPTHRLSAGGCLVPVIRAPTSFRYDLCRCSYHIIIQLLII